jgi:hypothetical protein
MKSSKYLPGSMGEKWLQWQSTRFIMGHEAVTRCGKSK